MTIAVQTQRLSLSKVVSSLTALAAALWLAGCTVPPKGAGSSPNARPDHNMPAERVAMPGEASLAQGIKQYQAGQYPAAEAQLKLALRQGLPIGPDLASAHKYLAFIYCTSQREALCHSAFKAARQADPAFVLTKAEAGHPMWGPVYKKALPTSSR